VAEMQGRIYRQHEWVMSALFSRLFGQQQEQMQKLPNKRPKNHYAFTGITAQNTRAYSHKIDT